MRRLPLHRRVTLLSILLVCLASCSRSDNNDNPGGDGGGGDTDCTANPTADGCEPPVFDDDPGLGDAVDQKSTVEPHEPYSKFQLDDLVFVSNVYDGRAHRPDVNNQLRFTDGEQDFVRWTIPVAQAVPASGSTCNIPQGNAAVKLEYRMTALNNVPEKYDFVRAFPAMVLGTMGGRYESWGALCDDPALLGGRGIRHDTDFFDMTPVQTQTTFPTLAANLRDPVKVSVKADITSDLASNGIANIFLDSYWHDVSADNKLPGQDSQWRDTINGINSNITEVWNLNIWFDWPDSDNRNINQWTGGESLGTVQIPDNPEFEILIKAEGERFNKIPTCTLGGQSNCFIYIALVLTDRELTRSGVTINYTEIASWMKSEDFRDLFLEGADMIGTASAQETAYEIWKTIDGSFNDSAPDAANRGPRFPDDSHLIGGLHLGSELWFNPQGAPATIEFDTLGIRVEGSGTFGRYTEYSQ